MRADMLALAAFKFGASGTQTLETHARSNRKHRPKTSGDNLAKPLKLLWEPNPQSRCFRGMDQVLNQSDITVAALASSRLVYTTDIENGITRKLGKNGYLYYAPDGGRITDSAEILRLNALAIPPAYIDVRISPNPLSHLQAIGIDARGLRQYRYHPEWHSERARAKFDQLLDFGERLPDIRARVDTDLRARAPTMDKALATVVWMLDNLYIRIGNAAYAEDNGSFGLTTLRRRHVKTDGSKVKFRFNAIAAMLVNTRAVCRSSYIHPVVFDEFKAGRLGQLLRTRPTRSKRLLKWMDAEEARVLGWLKSVS